VLPDGQRRLRLRFTKAGKIRFTSHRDVARMWERALRRSRLPLAYSQGFSPHPLVSFGLALPTGCESLGEYLDLRLEVAGPQEIPLADLPTALSELLPEGIEVEAAALIGEAEGSLQQEVASCDWELEVLGVRDEELQERVEKVLAAPMLIVSRERKGRQTALGAPAAPGRACRTHQWIERDGARFEPLLVGEPWTDGDATQHARRAFPHVRDGNQPEPGGSPPGANGGQRQH
jgi:radical SAM-linked protein